MQKGKLSSFFASVLVVCLILFSPACGGGYGGNGNAGGGGGGNAPAAPTGLTATPGNAQVALSWTTSSGATSYHVKRSTTNGGPYTQISAPAGTSYDDTNVIGGVAYYYIVTALNAYGESANSSQASATPTTATTAITVNVDVMSDRHNISPFIYGVNFPKDPTYIQDSGATMVRWGGNAATPYNWTNFYTNASSDWYFLNRPWDSSPNPSWPVDSVQYVIAVKNA